MRSGRGGERFLDAGEKFGAIATEKIKRSGLDQALNHLAVGEAGIEPAAKILQRSEIPSPFALRDRRCHRAFADILDRGEPIADGFNVGAAFAPRSSVVPRGAQAPPTFQTFRREFQPLRFMSGGRIGMPIRLHSPTKTEILSVLLISLLNKPAMNSTG